ncbi:MAG: GTP cyclohydrolase I, partial [Terriglobia bacterium]
MKRAKRVVPLEGTNSELAADPMENYVRELIRLLDEDPVRQGLAKTPRRVAQSLRFLTRGYHQDIDRLLNGALFDVAYDEMVIVK